MFLDVNTLGKTGPNVCIIQHHYEVSVCQTLNVFAEIHVMEE